MVVLRSWDDQGSEGSERAVLPLDETKCWRQAHDEALTRLHLEGYLVLGGYPSTVIEDDYCTISLCSRRD